MQPYNSLLDFPLISQLFPTYKVSSVVKTTHGAPVTGVSDVLGDIYPSVTSVSRSYDEPLSAMILHVIMMLIHAKPTPLRDSVGMCEATENVQ